MKTILTIIGILFGMQFQILAQTLYETDGNQGSVNWATSTNWLGDVAPVLANEVHITISDGDTVTSSLALLFKKATTIIIESGAMLIFDSGAEIDIDAAEAAKDFNIEVKDGGTFHVIGDLTAKKEATFLIAGIMGITGNVNLKNSPTPSTITVTGTGTLNVGGTITEGTTLVGEENITQNNTNPLPIELTYFKAINNNSKITLQWETASETNNDYFTIERSEDGVNFYSIITVNGSGNSASTLVYASQDNYPINGMNYYRLKQTDYNGDFSYSNLQSVNVQGYSIQEVKEVSIYPNPIESPNYILSLDIPGDYYNENALIRVYAMNGQEVIEYEIGLEGTNNKTAIDISNFKSGNYVILVLTSINSFKNKLVVL